jgi:glutathione S-transferase
MDWKAYQRVIGERPSAQRVTADRKAWQERAAAKA